MNLSIVFTLLLHLIVSATCDSVNPKKLQLCIDICKEYRNTILTSSSSSSNICQGALNLRPIPHVYRACIKGKSLAFDHSCLPSCTGEPYPVKVGKKNVTPGHAFESCYEDLHLPQSNLQMGWCRRGYDHTFKFISEDVSKKIMTLELLEMEEEKVNDDVGMVGADLNKVDDDLRTKADEASHIAKNEIKETGEELLTANDYDTRLENSNHDINTADHVENIKDEEFPSQSHEDNDDELYMDGDEVYDNPTLFLEKRGTNQYLEEAREMYNQRMEEHSTSSSSSSEPNKVTVETQNEEEEEEKWNYVDESIEEDFEDEIYMEGDEDYDNPNSMMEKRGVNHIFKAEEMYNQRLKEQQNEL